MIYNMQECEPFVGVEDLDDQKVYIPKSSDLSKYSIDRARRTTDYYGIVGKLLISVGFVLGIGFTSLFSSSALMSEYDAQHPETTCGTHIVGDYSYIDEYRPSEYLTDPILAQNDYFTRSFDDGSTAAMPTRQIGDPIPSQPKRAMPTPTAEFNPPAVPSPSRVTYCNTPSTPSIDGFNIMFGFIIGFIALGGAVFFMSDHLPQTYKAIRTRFASLNGVKCIETDDPRWAAVKRAINQEKPAITKSENPVSFGKHLRQRLSREGLREFKQVVIDNLPVETEPHPVEESPRWTLFTEAINEHTTLGASIDVWLAKFFEHTQDTMYAISIEHQDPANIKLLERQINEIAATDLAPVIVLLNDELKSRQIEAECEKTRQQFVLESKRKVAGIWADAVLGSERELTL